MSSIFAKMNKYMKREYSECLFSKNFNSKIGLGLKTNSYAMQSSIAAQPITYQKISNYRPIWPPINEVTDPGPLLGKATCRKKWRKE